MCAATTSMSSPVSPICLSAIPLLKQHPPSCQRRRSQARCNAATNKETKHKSDKMQQDLRYSGNNPILLKSIMHAVLAGWPDGKENIRFSQHLQIEDDFAIWKDLPHSLKVERPCVAKRKSERDSQHHVPVSSGQQRRDGRNGVELDRVPACKSLLWRAAARITDDVSICDAPMLLARPRSFADLSQVSSCNIKYKACDTER
jgi:hypothetical protein